MTAALHEPRAVGAVGAVRDDHDPAVSRWVVATTIAIAVASSIWTAPGWLAVTAVVVVVAVLGIPHGAVDHLVVEVLDGPHDGPSRRRFLVTYALALGGVGLVWFTAPAVALAAFLAVSVHHFGQSDLAHLRLHRRHQLAVQWSRGVFLVGLPLVAHLTAVAPVIDRLGGGDPTTWAWLADRTGLWCGVLVAQHVAIGFAVSRTPGARPSARRHVGRESVTVAVLALVFLTADPLIGFTVYFGLWHSLAHLGVLAGVLGTGPFPMRSLARLAAPMTAIAVLGLAVVGAGLMLAGRTELLVPGVFVFISALTFPHLIVVDRLWRRARLVEPRPTPDHGARSRAGHATSWSERRRRTSSGTRGC